MASRAIINRKKNLINQFSAPVRSYSGFSSFAHRRFVQDVDRKQSEKKDQDLIIKQKEHLYFSSKVLLDSPSFTFGSRFGRSDIYFPLGVRYLSQSSRTASTATASQPKVSVEGSNNEDKNLKQKKEASAEDCDQAVEGLSSAKAKAKAKQLLESQKVSQTLVRKLWAKFLGIGPALRAIASMSREDWAVKLRHWKDEFVSTLKHYWLGIKLLWADVRISSRLLLKLASGKSLSRRERQQLTRTTADIFRLVPVAVFIIVPFMEFLLPVFLKLFPNMLPSTFQDKMKEQEALKRRLNARIEYAKFLQDTAKEMAKEVQLSRTGEIKQTAEDLDEFLSKIRTGANISNDEILNFAKLFNDELTLDNISRPRLINMCKYMGIPPYGTDNYLRYMLRSKLRKIKEDDKLIQAEGIETLSEQELRQACRDRGHLGLLSVEEMRQQLRDWLDLSLNQSVPSSLLILSRAFTVSGRLKPEEAVVATLSSLPDEVVDTVGTGLPSEDSVSERKRKLEFLEMQEELIKEEEKKQQKEEKTKIKESEISQEDIALKEMTDPTSHKSDEHEDAKSLEKKEQLCRISRALAVLASASSVSRERQEFLSLVNKEIEFYNSLLDKETVGEEEAKKLYKAAREVEEADEAEDKVASGEKVTSALQDRIDTMLQSLEKEIDDVDAKIGDKYHLLDRDHDGKITPEEVAAATLYLRDTLGKESVQELISNLSKDRDGKILVEDIVKFASQSDESNNDENGK